MKREQALVLAHRSYAVDLSEVRVQMHRRVDASPYWRGEVTAVWFRRRRAGLVAVLGVLWDFQDRRPPNALEFVRRVQGDGGGTVRGQWSQAVYWGSVAPGMRAEHLELLEPMLANFPAVPEGFDGWWFAEQSGESSAKPGQRKVGTPADVSRRDHS